MRKQRETALARRKWFAGLALLAGSIAGALLIRQRSSGRSEEVDLYFADGTLAVLDQDDPQAEELLGLARSLLSNSRPERQ